MQLSIIIPARNEAAGIETLLQQLQALRACGHEVILVDGGSIDATTTLAQPLCDKVLTAPAGRARQMNAGAQVAQGEVLWFLHADSQIPADAGRLMLDAVHDGHSWGRFDVRLSGSQRLLRTVGYLMNLRSRITGIATGDQGVFVRRDLFLDIGGFADLPLMEDIELTTRLKRQQRPACLRQQLLTSSRRWEQNGVLRTIALMWSLRLAWSLGVPVERLAVYYDQG